MNKHFPCFYFNTHDGELTMFKTDTLGKKVIIFIHFKEVVSPVGCLKLVSAEKCGVEIIKKDIGLPISIDGHS